MELLVWDLFAGGDRRSRSSGFDVGDVVFNDHFAEVV